MIEYAGILVFAALTAVPTLVFVVLAEVLGPKKPNPVKDQPFECGETPFELPSGRPNPVHFYVIAMLFIIFDVEIAFLFPWAVVFRGLGFEGFFSVLIFIAVILFGFVYALKKGALKPA